MQYSIDFQPLLPQVWLAIVLAIPALVILVSLILRRRGSLLRALTLAIFALALFNPVFLQEEREPTKATLAIVVDRSQSQKIDGRSKDSDQTTEQLQKALAAYPQFDIRIVEAAKPGPQDDGTSTRLFGTLQKSLADVPQSRLAGAVLITDGQVHDIPQSAEKFGFHAPVNALITGKPDEYDRRIRFIEAPRFGIANKEITLSMMVSDQGTGKGVSNPAEVEVLVNGERAQNLRVPLGKETPLTVTLPHAGNNIIEIRTPTQKGELTDINNHAAMMIDGVRENLKVLLVSGEPHNGLRTWRDLLKSDTGVDLIHFTILRPPEKQDNTPISQLSLIVFPTTELFVEKIHEFDLVIFDRYQHYDVLPLIYYDYVAQYVKAGGALLMATGPEFTGKTSLARTPLNSILPARPTNHIFEKSYLPQLTEEGKKHPVTRGLEGSETTPPKWGRWLRQIEATPDEDATVLMKGADNKPLLVTAHKGNGRVAMLLSDEGWLWARGFEGGGPYATLYRRMAHWLMKEPELEEEALFAQTDGNRLILRRQTMKDKIGPAHITLPSGEKKELAFTKQDNGIWTANMVSDEIGLFHIENDGKETLALVGPLNAQEFGDIVSTTEKLQPLAHETRGNVTRLRTTTNAALALPAIQVVKGDAKAGKNTIVLRESSDSRLLSVDSVPLYTGLFALLATLLVISAMWYREGR